ncbi:hypothetical protein K488DRAFT_79193 [Vararia minispora EC-137]|uniref:Uncharacterized protein n=1 Tax=Vararia minispora EC-137 TaxID=1314806 RepID=A0ACB8QH88_9AGAM|nr:hypothetical protein K488DRAFT_79193 [Vararia minispora EC-137]
MSDYQVLLSTVASALSFAYDDVSYPHVKELGGVVILRFKLARLTCVLALFILYIVSFAQKRGNTADAKAREVKLQGSAALTRGEEVDALLCATYAYASLLAFAALAIKKSISSTASIHLSVLMLVGFGVCSYRNIWPLMTFTLMPADAYEGNLVWVKIAVLFAAGIFIPLVTPRKYSPVDPHNPSPVPNPEQTASILSLVLYNFMNDIVFRAYRVSHFPFDQLPPLADYDLASNLYLDTFSGAPKKHMFIGLMRVFFWEFIIMALMVTGRAFVTFLAPIGINRLLSYIETNGEGAMVRPWVWISMLFLSPFLSALFFQWYIFITTSSLVRCQAIVTQLVFEHALRIRVKAEVGSNGVDKGKQTAYGPSSKLGGNMKKDSANLVGRINTLIGTDLENIVNGRDFLMLAIFSPLQCAFSIYFLYLLLGWGAFAGLFIMLLCIPLPVLIVRIMQGLQWKLMKKTDARVQTVTEMMGVLRMIKMFGWEHKISNRVAERRDEELKFFQSRELVSLLHQVLNYAIPVLVMIGSYATFTVVMKQELTPSVVFSSMSVFDMLRIQLNQIIWRVSPTIQAKVSLDRLTDFLQNTELLDAYSEETTVSIAERVPDPDIIGFKDAMFTWSSDATVDDGTQTLSRRNFTLRIDGEVVFKRGVINLIVGPTGSGKTSMLMALLGEMHFIAAGPGSWFHLPRTGGIAYAAQESWVQNETIKNNVLFGAAFDEERYMKVMHQCALERDLELFDAGDATEVGEKGLTLSGGQKARITLARAVYSSAEIVILDDVLAALDVHTSKWIVEKCFKGDLLQDRTIIIATHNVTLADPIAGFVIGLSTDGKVVARGSVPEALAHIEDLQIKVGNEVFGKNEEVIDREHVKGESKKKDGKLIMTEEIAEGHVSWKALKFLFESLGGPTFWPFFLACYMSSRITWWMGWWAEQYDLRPSSDISIAFYLGIFVCISFASLILQVASVVIFVLGLVRAVKHIHKLLIDAILGASLRWLDTTPTSRVIVRCTQDIQSVDSNVSQEMRILVEVGSNMLVKLASVIIITPIFLVPSAILAVAGGFASSVYMHAQMSVKREQSNMRAPILGHFGAAIVGLTSIRAYGAQEAFRLESCKGIDRFTRAARTNYSLNRWISIRVDALGGVFAAGLGSYLAYGPGSKNALPSNIGFALAMAVGFSTLILGFVRIYNSFELDSNSLERIHAYVHIEQESKPVRGKVPPASWPTNGDLRVEKLSARYSLDGPRVLQDLTFHVKSGERIGIVGRTGSGKSSLTLSLLRCIFTEGRVFYDGVDTDSINLDVLRSNITIIPQVPELLSGSLRDNLDPFHEHDDATLNSALRAAGLFTLQSAAGESCITLDSQVSARGGNLSVGQRQILALARALVRGSKLLILDEATSSIDYETDSVIQSSLRTELGNDVTVLTVAHRLQTIMDADKIMVLDAGHLVEFGKPSELLKKEGGYLRALVNESRDRDVLRAMAEGSAVLTPENDRLTTMY